MQKKQEARNFYRKWNLEHLSCALKIRKGFTSMVITKLNQYELKNLESVKARHAPQGNMLNDINAIIKLYVPVVSVRQLKILLTIVEVKKWSFPHQDCKGTFLNAHLENDEEIWIKVLKIPGTKFRGKTFELVKWLYGLRQAPVLWYGYLSSTLQNLGFVRSSTHEPLLLLSPSKSIVILVDVDYILILCDSNQIEKTISKLHKMFKATNLRRPTHILSLKEYFWSDRIFLSHSVYIQKCIEFASMSDAKPTKSPGPMSHPLHVEVIDQSQGDVALKYISPL